MTGPPATSAGGTLVVLPAPGAAVITTARDFVSAALIAGMKASTGSGTKKL
jgi:hypothetical protein